MDRKLWTEARAIAARRDPRGGGRSGAGSGVRDAGERRARRAAGGLDGAGRAERGHRSPARRAAARRAGAGDRAAAAPADPETALLARERRGLVRRALALLPRPQRRAALLRFHAELPFQTVAARLGTPEVTARTRVQRALTSLRARLGSLRAMLLRAGRAGGGAGVDGRRHAASGRAQPAAIAMADDDVVSAPSSTHGGASRLVRGAPGGRGDRDGATEGGRAGRHDLLAGPALQVRRRRDMCRTWTGPDGQPIFVVRPREAPVADRDPAALRAGDGQVAGRILAAVQGFPSNSRRAPGR